MKENIEVFFIRCQERADAQAPSYLVGPYLSAKDADARASFINKHQHRHGALELRSISATRLPQGNYLLNELRVFNLEMAPRVAEDGSLTSKAEEMYLPDDYFESSGEIV